MGTEPRRTAGSIRIPLPTFGFDLDARPRSYTDFPDPISALRNGVAGQHRREMIGDLLEGEDPFAAVLAGSVEDEILEERASEDFVRTLAGIFGPSWYGGEYLPALLAGEVEIARIALASATGDVLALRARWSGGRYRYRIVDEYEGYFRLSRGSSLHPLTLGQVVEILETVEGDVETGGRGLVRCWWDQQFDSGYDPAECTGFAWVESDLYPELGAWYGAYAEAWRREVTDRGPGSR